MSLLQLHVESMKNINVIPMELKIKSMAIRVDRLTDRSLSASRGEKLTNQLIFFPGFPGI